MRKFKAIKKCTMIADGSEALTVGKIYEDLTEKVTGDWIRIIDDKGGDHSFPDWRSFFVLVLDEYQWAEDIEVNLGSTFHPNWVRMKYVAKDPFVDAHVVGNKNQNYTVISNFIRKLKPKIKLTKEEIAEKFSIHVDNFEII